MEKIQINKLLYYQLQLIEWYKANKRTFPWRKTADPYKVLISEILLQQTDSAKAEQAYLNLINLCPNVYELYSIDEEKLISIFKQIGLIKRASILKSIAETIIKKFNGSVPDTKKELLELKGVGNYISNAVLCFAFSQPTAVLDTNVIRILERVFNIKSLKKRPRDDKKMQEWADLLLYKNNPKSYNYAVLDFASIICKAKKPLCNKCPISCICFNNN